MNVTKLKKYINLALNNSSEGEASTAARMFFSKLNSIGASFNPAVFGLKRSEAARLATLAGKIFRGLNDGSEVEVKTKPAEPKRKPEASQSGFSDFKQEFRSKRDCCYYYFHGIDMSNGHMRRHIIDAICRKYGFGKASVQSYASNFRKEFGV